MERVGYLILTAAIIATAATSLAASVAPVPQSQTQNEGDPEKGQALYTEKRCSICHKVGDQGGAMGPALTTVGDTRDAEWLAKYLPDPKSVNEANRMPAVSVTDEEMKDLIAYLLTLKASH